MGVVDSGANILCDFKNPAVTRKGPKKFEKQAERGQGVCDP